MTVRLGQHEDEEYSPPAEGMAGGQGWVSCQKKLSFNGPTPSASGGHPSNGGEFPGS